MRLFRDRSLNIAILISASWHLLCIFSIAPVLRSGPVIDNFTSVSFLGSIMERVSAVQEKPFALDSVSLMQKIKKMKNIDSEEVILTPPITISKIAALKPEKEKFMFSEDRYINIVFDRHYNNQKVSRIRFKESSFMGNARNRMVLYKPDLGRFSTLSYDFNSNYSVSVRFLISRHGFVERPECIASSGSFEIDHMAAEYVRRWQFIPHDETLQGVHAGIARVSFINRW